MAYVTETFDGKKFIFTDEHFTTSMKHKRKADDWKQRIAKYGYIDIPINRFSEFGDYWSYKNKYPNWRIKVKEFELSEDKWTYFHFKPLAKLNIKKYPDEIKSKNNYIYKFLDTSNTVIYIGKTSQSLINRLKNHNHLNEECYKSTKEIVYTTLNNDSDLELYETYLINISMPKYNKDKRYNMTPSILLPELSYKSFKIY